MGDLSLLTSRTILDSCEVERLFTNKEIVQIIIGVLEVTNCVAGKIAHFTEDMAV